ncbi:MAG: DUF2937 family protein, partial [Rhodospirillaceae bacterium]|nr:DUF2937 family protein [Rhodospirillaceae bacterium]
MSTVDRFLAAVFVAVFALAASQAGPFASQYSARTAALLAQAQAHVKDVETGVRYQTMAPVVQGELAAEAKTALAARQAAHAAVADTIPFLRPIALWRAGEPALLAETWRTFAPALPFTPLSWLNAFLGCIIGFALYEGLKWPLVA